MRFVYSVQLILFVAALSVGQELPEVDAIGPQVGTIVPTFSLGDQRDQTQTPESIMGPNGAMLVFSRSADW